MITGKEIEKKVWPAYFQKILDGDKTFEVRLADWECNPGDTLILKEWDPEKKGYTGRSIKVKVTYVSKSKNWKSWPEEDIEKYGFQVIGFEPVFQERVRGFMIKNGLDEGFTVYHRFIDLVNELGEVGKEILKADDYGRRPLNLALEGSRREPKGEQKKELKEKRELEEQRELRELEDRIKDRIEDEIGDAFYSLITLANAFNVDLVSALDKTLEKYGRRIRKSGLPGSSE